MIRNKLNKQWRENKYNIFQRYGMKKKNNNKSLSLKISETKSSQKDGKKTEKKPIVKVKGNNWKKISKTKEIKCKCKI